MGGSQCIDFNDDACNTQSEIYFTPTTTGSYDILLDEYPCGGTFIVNTNIYVQLMYINGTCGYNNTLYLTASAPTVLNQIVPFTQTWGGDFNRATSMIAGNTYRIYTCGSTSFDSQLSVFTAGGGQAVAADVAAPVRLLAGHLSIALGEQYLPERFASHLGRSECHAHRMEGGIVRNLHGEVCLGTGIERDETIGVPLLTAEGMDRYLCLLIEYLFC